MKAGLDENKIRAGKGAKYMYFLNIRFIFENFL